MTATSTPPRRLTWQEFLDLPEDPALRHAELINGEVIVTTPSVLHQRIDPRIPEALIARAPDGADGTVLVDAADLDHDDELCSPLLPGFGIRLGDLIER